MPGDARRVTELKRSHPWFMDAPEPELVCNKKKAVEDVNNRAVSGTPDMNISLWENSPNFQSGSGLFTDCLYGPELAGTYNFAARNMSPVGASDFNFESSSLEKQVRCNSSILLSVSHDVDNPTSFLNYGAGKYLVNQVADYNRVPENVFGRGITCNKVNESFISPGPIFDTGSGNIIPVGPTHDKVNTNVISMETTYEKVNSSISSMDHKYNKGEGSYIYFEGFQYDPEANNPSSRIFSSYDLLMSQPLVQPFEVPPQAPRLKDLVLPNSEPSVNVSATSTSQNDATAKTKVQKKTTAQKTPSNVSQNNFPSNAKSLLATGIFDGVPVKYVSWSRDVSCQLLLPISFE